MPNSFPWRERMAALAFDDPINYNLNADAGIKAQWLKR